MVGVKKNLNSNGVALLFLTGLTVGGITLASNASFSGDPDPRSPTVHPEAYTETGRAGDYAEAAQIQAASGIEFTFKLKDSAFDLSITQKFPPGIRLDDVVNAYTSATLANHVSDFVEKVERQDLPATVAAHQPAGAFYLLTTGLAKTPVGDFHKIARSICADSRNALVWNRNCVMDTTNSTTRTVFHSGSNTTSCSESGLGSVVTCTFKFLGKPKNVNFVIISRNAEQLAVSGVVQTIRDTGAVFTYLVAGHRATLSGRSVDLSLEESAGAKALATFRDTAIGQYAEDMRFGKDYELAEDEELEGKTLTEYYSELTGRKSRTLQ